MDRTEWIGLGAALALLIVGVPRFLAWTQRVRAKRAARRAARHHHFGQLDQALVEYDRALLLEPSSLSYLASRAELLLNLGRLQAAVADLSTAISLYPRQPHLYCARGVAYGGLYDYVSAIADYSRALALSPQYGRALASRASAHLSLGQLDEAIADYSAMLMASPGNTLSLARRGYAYILKGDYDTAIADMSVAIKMGLEVSEVYLNRGVAYYHVGQSAKAEDDYKHALAICPNLVQAHASLAGLAADRGDWALAVTYLDEALKRRPTYAAGYLSRGTARLRLGDPEKAAADFRNAARFAEDRLTQALAQQALNGENDSSLHRHS